MVDTGCGGADLGKEFCELGAGTFLSRGASGGKNMTSRRFTSRYENLGGVVRLTLGEAEHDPARGRLPVTGVHPGGG